MDSIEKLALLLREFPGIGPRQAKRFVYFLLTRQSGFLKELTEAITELNGTISQCADCQRYFPQEKEASRCAICRNGERDSGILLVVEKDVDLDAIEKSRAHRGYYFVLGGIVPIIEKNPAEKIRTAKLRELVEKKKGELKELVLALSATTEGDHTTDYLREELGKLAGQYGFVISTLGRGLSTGTELEYSDNNTIKSAFANRS